MVTWAADTFTRANSSTTLGNAETGGAWTAHAGTWGILTNLGYCATPLDAAHDRASLSVPQADVTVSADITLSGTTNRAFVGLLLRYADASNYLEVYLSKVVAGTGVPNDILLRQNVGGSFSTLVDVTTAGLVNGTTYNLKCVFSGATVTVYVDGVRRIPSTRVDSTLQSQKYGMTLYKDTTGSTWDDGQSRFDNFLITTPDPVSRMGRVLSA